MGGIVILLAILAVLALIVGLVLVYGVGGKLRSSQQEGTLPDQRESERPEHLEVGTDEQLDDADRAGAGTARD